MPCVPEPRPAKQLELEYHQGVTKATARLVPLILIGIVGYALWVVVVTLGADYLIHPSAINTTQRIGAGVAIIVLFFLLLIPVAITYLRLLLTVSDPGFTPQRINDRSWGVGTTHDAHDHRVEYGVEKPGMGPHGESATVLNLEAIFQRTEAPPPGIEKFYEKDAFVCDSVGLPRWCSTCSNWKDDRTHHCTDVGRCVRKLDHFCPWVGGVVGEKNFKFFIQFTFYTAIFTGYIMILLAYFVAEAKRKHASLNPNWCVVLGLGALFMIFTATMAITSINLASLNMTQIDKINPKKQMYLAVLLPAAPDENPDITCIGAITYPIGALEGAGRTFLILQTEPGANPWDLGRLKNFKAVMGKRVWEWFLPLQRSDPGGSESAAYFYEFGPGLQDVKRAAGLLPLGA